MTMLWEETVFLMNAFSDAAEQREAAIKVNATAEREKMLLLVAIPAMFLIQDGEDQIYQHPPISTGLFDEMHEEGFRSSRMGSASPLLKLAKHLSRMLPISLLLCLFDVLISEE
uniref:Uncharacterized protein n=1 Tax=Cannabis sativa TaxID=3483 RepID=A0A803PHJ6_CANSA